jgi:virginiamycin B lyase
MKRALCFGVVLLIVSVFMILVSRSVSADANPQILVEYDVPGKPQHIAVESPGHIWFTMPEDNMIGYLVVTSTVDYKVITYSTTITEPYDIDLQDGLVWFTGRAGNQIGRLDPESDASDQILEFQIPTPDSEPTGIDALASDTVWFVEKTGNKIGKLIVTDTLNYVFEEYPLDYSFDGGPVFPSDAQPEDLYVQSNGTIWFTAPGAEALGNFRPSYWPWSPNALTRISVGEGGQPWRIEVDQEGYPWFTERSGNRLGKFFPQTLANFEWYALKGYNGNPRDLILNSESVWFTQPEINCVGRLDRDTKVVQTFFLANAHPLGIGIDSEKHVWVAENALFKVAEWRPPYFHFVYLPVVIRNAN